MPRNPPKLDSLRKIGWAYWDPLRFRDLLDGDGGSSIIDEYDSYLLQVCGKLLSGASKEDARRYLQSVMTDQMGLEPPEYDDSTCLVTVDKIADYLQTLR